MAERVFGPIRAAGTQITELEGEKPIEPSALGWVGYGAILEKGPVGELIEASSPDIARRRVGSYIADSLAPDAIYHFFARAVGAGGVFLVRVTDGNEVQSEYMLYARRGALLTPVGRLKAHNGGRWGGKLKRYSADLSVITKLTNTTLDTEDTTTFETDEYKGGYIQLSGGLNAAKQYKIISNTAAGVFTVASDQTMRDDLDAGTPADLRYYLVRENEGKALSVLLRDGDEDPDNEFGLFVYVDGTLVLQKPNLSMDPENTRWWVDLINNDTANYEIEAEDLWTGAITADIRPANHYVQMVSATATVLTAEIHDYTENTSGSPTFTLGTTTDAMVAQKITCTFTSATAFNAVSDKFGALGSGTTGTLFDPPGGAGGADKNKWVPPFTIGADASIVADETCVINYKPFVADELIDGFLFPNKPKAKRTKFRITDNTHKTITLADGSDMTADAVYPATYSVTTGDATPSIAFEDFDSTMVDQTITCTFTSATAFDAVSDVLGALGSGTVGTLFNPSDSRAPSFTISNGTVALETADVITIAYSGGQAMVEAAREFEGGRDGNADIVDADYIGQAWNVDTSPFNAIEGRNMGLIKFATPGVTATAVQKAGIAYADAKNHQYREEIPSAITTEDAADEYVNDTIGRSNYKVDIFPSYAYVVDPEGADEAKLKLVPATGMIHGREARIAADNIGYHKAQAGVNATLPDIVKLPTGDRILDEETLNPRGINVIKKKQGNWVIWGDRVPATDPAWKWKHQREQMSYYEHVLQESFDWIIFALHNVATQQLLLASLNSFFIPEWNKGALNGRTYDEAVDIKVDSEINTLAAIAAGDMFADIILRLVGVVERLRLRIGKAGIFEATV